MDTHAARRARQKAIKADLTQAYTDEEASPPEWVDLLATIRKRSAELKDEIALETRAFVEDPDIRTALARRNRFATRVREGVESINQQIRRLNLVAPHARFTRAALHAEELLHPLYRSSRTTRSSGDPSAG